MPSNIGDSYNRSTLGFDPRSTGAAPVSAVINNYKQEKPSATPVAFYLSKIRNRDFREAWSFRLLITRVLLLLLFLPLFLFLLSQLLDVIQQLLVLIEYHSVDLRGLDVEILGNIQLIFYQIS